MTVIKQEDLIQSIADSLQYISYYHPLDYIQALGRAYELEESPAARDAIAQILTNSRMCAEGKRPICQDTGIVTVFVKVGMDVRWDGATMGVTDMINEGVRRGEASAPARSRRRWHTACASSAAPRVFVAACGAAACPARASPAGGEARWRRCRCVGPRAGGLRGQKAGSFHCANPGCSLATLEHGGHFRWGAPQVSRRCRPSA
jgi:hypothetical protein